MKARIDMVKRRLHLNPHVFTYFNANPYNKNTNDCVIRAVCCATEREWDDVLMDMTKCALKHKLMVNDPDLYPIYLKEIGWVKQKQPRKVDGKKYHGYEWIPHYKGMAIIHIGDHHMAFVNDGKLWDTWDSSGGIVGVYWTPKRK